MSLPIYLAPGFLSLPESVKTVLLRELPTVGGALSPAQLIAIWQTIVNAQALDYSKGALLAECAVSAAAYCPELEDSPRLQELHGTFVELERHELDFDSDYVVSAWLSLRDRLKSVSGAVPS